MPPSFCVRAGSFGQIESWFGGYVSKSIFAAIFKVFCLGIAEAFFMLVR